METYEVGLESEDIDTPALLIDLDKMEKNISTMANFFKGKTAKLRAHTKVHRTPIIAHKQIEAGAKGICCQKVAEAEIMVASGIKNIIVSNEIVTPSKIRRLIALTNYADIIVPIDAYHNAKALSKASLKQGKKLKVMVDIHMGSDRCGVEPGEPTLKLAKRIQQLKGLSLIGLMGFEGHVSSMQPREKRRTEIERLEGLLVDTKELLGKSGIEVYEISTGSTGTYDVSGTIPGITEIQAGTYILMASEYHKATPEFDCALSVITTIISKPSDERIITDAGRMSIYTMGKLPEVVGWRGLEPVSVHAENTILKKSGSVDIEVGDKIELIPPYLDGTVKLHDRFYAKRKGRIEAVWKILGRDSSK